MELWERWQQHHERQGLDPSDICRDGILSRAHYQAANPKVLFVLKETNDYRSGLQQLLADGPRHQTWHAIARWAAGIINGFPPFDQVKSKQVMKESLRAVAAINLKKQAGHSRVGDRTVHMYAYSDRGLLREQVELIRPDLVLACGVYEQLVWILEPETTVEQLLSGTFMIGAATVVEWRHPGFAGSREYYERLGSRLSDVDYVRREDPHGV